MAIAYNFTGVRAKTARYRLYFTSIVNVSLIVAAIIVALFGMSLLVFRSTLGWFILSLAAWPIMVFMWQKWGLVDLPPRNGTALDDYLESSVLKNLPRDLTPYDLSVASMQSQSAQFFTARFGISPQFMTELSSHNSSDTEVVIEQAEVYRQQAGEKLMTGGMIVAALCATQTQINAMLPHLQLDESDLKSGVLWYRRLKNIIEEDKRLKRTGGIARDWSFGWTNLLNRFGVNLSERAIRGGVLFVEIASQSNALKLLNEIFGSNGRQNAVLIGTDGVGKSTIVNAFAESLVIAPDGVPDSLKYRQIISLDASSIISAADSRSAIEDLVNRLLIEAYRSKNVILCLDNAQLFLEDRPGSVDLTSIIMPVIDGGGIRLIMTMDEQRYLQISQRNPTLASLFNRINVQPADEGETIQVMQDQIIQIEFQRRVTYMYQALKQAYRMSERFMHEIEQPGNSIRLLEQAAGYDESGLVTSASVIRAIEDSNGVKVGQAESVDEKEKLLNLEKLIHQRMINQTRAVGVVSDALRRARTGVRNETRPIGTFLFLGPTGVGKTELSKALAEVYFGGEEHMLRLDLNEYVRSEDVARLIADGAQEPNSLTANIMKQPYSVVLLDEIEKAHPQVLTTLLQLLDEGVLRDVNNHEVSFRDAIVIATSNAGSERIRQLIDEGQQIEKFETQLVNELIDLQQFRPEFLNRFDEIVVFRPLTKDELGQVAQLMINGLNKTLEPQKITVKLDELAIKKLTESGYDPRLGARPMRRAVQRSVENLIAKRLLEGQVQPGDVITISEKDIAESNLL